MYSQREKETGLVCQALNSEGKISPTNNKNTYINTPCSTLREASKSCMSLYCEMALAANNSKTDDVFAFQHRLRRGKHGEDEVVKKQTEYTFLLQFFFKICFDWKVRFANRSC